jgi:hypothetical protein
VPVDIRASNKQSRHSYFLRSQKQAD